jgi:beta-lactamase class A
VVDLSGPSPSEYRYAADDPFAAGSTYKLPALMDEAQRIAEGRRRSTDRLCFHAPEAEDGWFDDYNDGDCLALQEVASRAGTYSDNTAGHMLVDDLGGPAALNSYAQSKGASRSSFYEPNQTTAADLAALWTSEATGRAGGAAAQQWLYPILTRTRYESGIPAGVPASATVVHKVGSIDQTVNDAGLVSAGSTRYVVAITTDGLGGDDGWALVARISAVVWAREAGAAAH